MKIDKFGRIVTLNEKNKLDGGDTCANESAWRWSEIVLHPNRIGSIQDAMFSRSIEKEPGIYVRHPSNEVPFWNDPKEFSRDNNIPLIIFLGESGQDHALDRHFKAFAKRGFFYQNKDVPAFWLDIMCLFGRQYLKRYAQSRLLGAFIKFALQFADIYLLADTFFRTKQMVMWDHDSHSFIPNKSYVDDRNLIMLLCDAKKTYRTLLSDWAFDLYLKKRADHLWASDNQPNWKSAILRYYSKETGNNEEIGFNLIYVVTIMAKLGNRP